MGGQLTAKPLTKRQQEVLAFIEEHHARRGFAPSLREIGKHCGIRSTNGVADHLRCLERKGALRRDPMLSRSIVVNRMDAGPMPSVTGAAAGVDAVAEPIVHNQSGLVVAALALLRQMTDGERRDFIVRAFDGGWR